MPSPASAHCASASLKGFLLTAPHLHAPSHRLIMFSSLHVSLGRIVLFSCFQFHAFSPSHYQWGLQELTKNLCYLLLHPQLPPQCRGQQFGPGFSSVGEVLQTPATGKSTGDAAQTLVPALPERHVAYMILGKLLNASQSPFLISEMRTIVGDKSFCQNEM